MIDPNVDFMWTRQKRRHALLLCVLGQNRQAIIDAVGCSETGFTTYFGDVETLAELALPDLLNLFERVDIERNMLELLQARSGTPEQARLRSSLLAKSKLHLVPQEVDIDKTAPALTSLTQLGAMSADELRSHVASLVPGLEHKNRVLRRRDTADTDASLSGDGTSAPAPAKG